MPRRQKAHPLRCRVRRGEVRLRIQHLIVHARKPQRRHPRSEGGQCGGQRLHVERRRHSRQSIEHIGCLPQRDVVRRTEERIEWRREPGKQVAKLAIPAHACGQKEHAWKLCALTHPETREPVPLGGPIVIGQDGLIFIEPRRRQMPEEKRPVPSTHDHGFGGRTPADQFPFAGGERSRPLRKAAEIGPFVLQPQSHRDPGFQPIPGLAPRRIPKPKRPDARAQPRRYRRKTRRLRAFEPPEALGQHALIRAHGAVDRDKGRHIGRCRVLQVRAEDLAMLARQDDETVGGQKGVNALIAREAFDAAHPGDIVRKLRPRNAFARARRLDIDEDEQRNRCPRSPLTRDSATALHGCVLPCAMGLRTGLRRT